MSSIRDFPGSPVVKDSQLPLQGAWAWSFLREIRSHSATQFSSVAQSCPTLCDPRELQHTRPLCPTPTPGAHPNPCPLSWWCHPTSSSSVVPFFCPQSYPASFFKWVSFSHIGVSASTSDLPMNTQDWSLLGWTGWISLQPKGRSRVFSNTTVQKCQFFDTQLSL